MWNDMRSWGSKQTWLFGAVLVILTMAVVLVLLPEGGVDTTPTSDDQNIEVVPATGIEGFKVKEFCQDPETTVLSFPAPDALGTTYQLTRMRDGRSETVTALINPNKEIKFATHYYSTDVGQDSEPADMTGAFDCIEKKAQ